MISIPPLHTTRFRLGYADTDPAGILYYATWFPWIERLQSEWFFLNGWRQDELLDRHGFGTVTRRTTCDYLIAVGLFDEISIEMRLDRVGERSFTFVHDLLRVGMDEPDQLVARATITLVTVGRDGAAIPIPDPLRDQLRSWASDSHG